MLVEEKKVSTKAAKVKNELSELKDRLQIAFFLRWLSNNGNHGRGSVAQSLDQSCSVPTVWQAIFRLVIVLEQI